MSGTWNPQIPHIRDGEPVDAAVTSRPDRVLESNISYVRDRIDDADLGESGVAYNVTVAPNVNVGQPVFYNASSRQFELALAALTTDLATGTVGIAPSADCLGICAYKHNATLADVLLNGRAVVDVSNAAGSNPPPGRYFLSSAVPGGLVQQSPAISVPVLFLDGSGYAYVNPLTRNFLTDHVHYKFDLVCAPAGTTSQPSLNARHVVTGPNANLPGWLPASHASFNGLAPAGAAWGYNLAKHPKLQNVWPPIPVESAALVWDKGADYTGGTMVPLGTKGGLAVIDANGIWWMSDCYGMVPWPLDYNSASPPAAPADDTTPPTCPPPKYMRLTLGYGMSVYASKGGIVTSLRSVTPWIQIADPDGVPAAVGPLVVSGNLDLAVNPADVPGSRVLKSFANNSFSRGYVAEGIRVAGDLSATSTHTDATDPLNPIHQGVVSITLASNPSVRELSAQVVRESSIDDRVIYNVPALVFPASRPSALYLTYDVPSHGLSGGLTLALKLWLMGLTTGTLPDLAVTYRVLPAPAANATVALPTSDSTVSIDTEVAVTAYNYASVASSAFNVTPGAKVLISITRAGSDGYAGDVACMTYQGILTSGN
jgi:hypothetical protein